MDDVSCRIVVVASSLAKGTLLIDNITSFNKGSQSQGLSNAPIVLSSSTEPIYHPWSISNRYYAADVHFALHTVSKVYGAVFESVPAVIVAWTKGEPFEEYIETVHKAIEEHGPEVLLAVRLPKDQEHATSEAEAAATKDEEEEEDNNSIDAKLISYGFEYIDASDPYEAPPKDASEEGPAEGIPHIPRVVDALSTIMWPSMSSGNSGGDDNDDDDDDDDPSHSRDPRRPQSTLEAIINRDPLAILQVLEELDAHFNFELGREDDTELFKAIFQEDQVASPVSDSDSADWTYSSNEISGGLPEVEADPFVQATPININFDGNDDEAFGMFMDATGKKPKVSLGFEDDFTVFVSTPVDDVNVVDEDFSHLRHHSSGRSTPDDHFLQSGKSAHAGSLYHSLGSSSDLHHVEDT